MARLSRPRRAVLILSVAGHRHPAVRGRDWRWLRARHLSVAPALFSVLLAGGCAINPVPTDVAIAGMPNPEAALQQSMQQVDAEMAELGQLSPGMRRICRR
jgi:hypothetical protein